MIKLEENFISGMDGFAQDPLTYTQIQRTDNVALYKRSRNGIVKDYEVFNIKITPKGTDFFGTASLDDKEIYPKANSFGKTAWSYSNLGAAKFKFNELVNPPEHEIQEIKWPETEFTTREFAELNDLTYAKAQKLIKENPNIEFVGKKDIKTTRKAGIQKAIYYKTKI